MWCASSRQPEVPADLSAAIGLVRARGSAAQLHVLRGGRPVIDYCQGCQPDSLFWIFSASKPLVALAVHLLAERAELDLDDRVAGYWPAFGQRGKQAITIRQVLQHRSGVAVAGGRAMGGAVGDALLMADWQRSVRRIEQAAPRWPPGSVPAYHYISYGFILGELVRQVAGTGVDEFVRDQLTAPLGLGDTYLGLPDELQHRAVPLTGRWPGGLLSQGYLNRKAVRAAVIPAAGISTTARDLARLYQALLLGGVAADGTRVLADQTIAAARQPSCDGETDRFLKLRVRWSQGFQLGGGHSPGRGCSPPLGWLASPLAFGHNGSNACIGWADPDRQLAFAYLTGTLDTERAGSAHMAAVADAVLAACA